MKTYHENDIIEEDIIEEDIIKEDIDEDGDYGNYAIAEYDDFLERAERVESTIESTRKELRHLYKGAFHGKSMSKAHDLIVLCLACSFNSIGPKPTCLGDVELSAVIEAKETLKSYEKDFEKRDFLNAARFLRDCNEIFQKHGENNIIFGVFFKAGLYHPCEVAKLFDMFSKVPLLDGDE